MTGTYALTQSTTKQCLKFRIATLGHPLTAPLVRTCCSIDSQMIQNSIDRMLCGYFIVLYNAQGIYQNLSYRHF